MMEQQATLSINFIILTMASMCCCPGCEKPGMKLCSACKNAFYCGPTCQTADWPHHREECEGNLQKVGMKHLSKGYGYNFEEAIRQSNLGLAKLKAMKKQPLDAISELLKIKCVALSLTDRLVESLQCAEENYNLWAVSRGPAHPSTIDASFYLIDHSLANKLYEKAELYARTLWEIIHNDRESRDIPAAMRPLFVARAASLLSQAIQQLAASGGIPPEKKEKAGTVAIARARQSVEAYTQLSGTEDGLTATAMVQLARTLDYFNDVDDDEILLLCKQAITIIIRVDRHTSQNVAVSEDILGAAYEKRATRAHNALDLERCATNLELTLPHFLEAERIHRANKNVVDADQSHNRAERIEEKLRRVVIAKARAVAAAVPVAEG